MDGDEHRLDGPQRLPDIEQRREMAASINKGLRNAQANAAEATAQFIEAIFEFHLANADKPGLISQSFIDETAKVILNLHAAIDIMSSTRVEFASRSGAILSSNDLVGIVVAERVKEGGLDWKKSSHARATIALIVSYYTQLLRQLSLDRQTVEVTGEILALCTVLIVTAGVAHEDNPKLYSQVSDLLALPFGVLGIIVAAIALSRDNKRDRP